MKGRRLGPKRWSEWAFFLGFLPILFFGSLPLKPNLGKKKVYTSSSFLPTKTPFKVPDLTSSIIVTSQGEIHLKNEGRWCPSNNRVNPWVQEGKLSLTIQSLYPDWTIFIKATQLEGPRGTLPPSRLSITLSDNKIASLSLDKPVPILWSRSPITSKVVNLMLTFQPTWKDLPGHYEGELILWETFPYESPYEGFFLPTSYNDFEGLPKEKRLINKTMPKPYESIRISLDIPEIIMVSLNEKEISFSGIKGPGVYQADHEIRFTVTSNSPNWRVLCRASPLQSKNYKISQNRISWERLDRFGKKEDEGRLSIDPVPVASGGPGTVNEEVVLVFKLRINPEDLAGSYSGEISLIGVSGLTSK